MSILKTGSASNTKTTANTDTITTGAPTGAAAGDFGLIFVLLYGGTEGVATPAGWTALYNNVGFGSGGAGGRVAVFYKAGISSGEASSGVTVTTNSISGTRWANIFMLTATAGAAIADNSQVANECGTVDNVTTTAVAVGANDLVVFNIMELCQGGDIVAPSGTTELYDVASPLIASIRAELATASPGANGSYSKTFNYTQFGGGTSRDGRATAIVLTAGNNAPVASAGSATVNQDSSANNITCVATDADSDPLTYSIVSGPSHGSVGAFAGAVVQYTPTPGYSGSDSFTFKANDTHVDSNTATVTITVTARSAPVLSAFASTLVSDVQATLGAHVVSEVDAASSWHVEWGKTGAYGHTEATGTVALNTAADVTFRIRNLEPGTTYHWRIVATNIHGTTNGADQTFTTSAAPTYRFGRLASGVGS